MGQDAIDSVGIADGFVFEEQRAGGPMLLLLLLLLLLLGHGGQW